MNQPVQFSKADFEAIDHSDSVYLNAKGANYYRLGEYDHAVAYYHVAASMNNTDALSNLGYCYLYGRHVESNVSLAIAYFKLAAQVGHGDALYKLGAIHSSPKWGVLDEELSLYYYRQAASQFLEDPLESYQDITWCQGLSEYPSLCLVLGRAFMPGGLLLTNLDLAYQFLKFAAIGYAKEIQNNGTYYEKSYENVLELLSDTQFDIVRQHWDEHFDAN